MKNIAYLKLKSVDMDIFTVDVIDSGLPVSHHKDLDMLVDTYNFTMSTILEKHTPFKKWTVTIHLDALWMNDGLKNKKREKSKAGRKWRKGTTIH